jgi:hypothetical protein
MLKVYYIHFYCLFWIHCMLLVTDVVSIGNDHAHKFYKLAKR